MMPLRARWALVLVIMLGAGCAPAKIAAYEREIQQAQAAGIDGFALDTTSLAAGASVTLTATGGSAGVNYWIATAGSHTVTAWVDDVNRMTESNESNNKLTQTVIVSTGSSVTPVVQIDAGGRP